MRQFIQRVAACAGLLALGALPIAGLAATAEPSTTYTTALTQTYGSLAPYTGSLKLTVGSDGIVRGYYFPADYSASYIPVTGGRTGDRIWFDIGNDGQYHVIARVSNGQITGTAFTPDNVLYTFVAKPD